MKRIVFLSLMLFALTVSVSAQNYTVQSVTGRVQFEKGGSRIDVKAEDTLTAETIIHTGIGASLILKEGEKTFTVSAAKSGKVVDLAAAASGVRISGNVAKTDTSAVSRTTSQTSTASARASDAAGDGEIDAE